MLRENLGLKRHQVVLPGNPLKKDAGCHVRRVWPGSARRELTSELLHIDREFQRISQSAQLHVET